MGIKDQINKDLTESMKARDAARTETLRLIRAEVLKKEKEKAAPEIDDPLMIQLLRSMIKQRKESIEMFEKGHRPDLIEKEQAQLNIIESYLPAEMDESVIDRIIEETLKETGATSAKEMGKVMAVLMKKLKDTGGLFDGKTVNAKVKAKLG